LFTLRNGSLPTITHSPLQRRSPLRSLAARRGIAPPKRTISALQRHRSSIWPGIDRWASGPPPLTPGEHTSSLTLRLRTFRFPFGCGDQLLNLANEQDSLGHFSKRTTGRCSYHRFHAQSACTQLVSRSFHIPSRILFSFHSRYL